jgi:hypothetical protein
VHVLQELGIPATNYVDLQGLCSGLGRVHLGDHLRRLSAEMEQLAGLAVEPGGERIGVGDVQLRLAQALGAVTGRAHRGQIVAAVAPA